MIIYDDSEIKENARLEQLLDALERQDESDLKIMFSKKAIDEADDFDGSMKYLLELFQGNVVSWELDRFGGGGSVDNGRRSTRVDAFYTVTTDKDQYRFYLKDYLSDTINPDNEGLYTLHVIKAEEADKDSPFIINWDYEDVPGIYKPEEE